MGAFGGGISGGMVRSVSGLGGLVATLPCSRRMRRGGFVAGRAIRIPEPPKAACKGSQILSAKVTCFGWETISIPALSGMLPNRMQKERKALRTCTSDFGNRFTGVLYSSRGDGCVQVPLYSGCSGSKEPRSCLEVCDLY